MKGKGLQFAVELDLPKDVYDVKVLTDKKRLRQVFLNLISNSMKFTVEGYVNVAIRVIDHDMMEVVIKDTGIGIKQED